MVLIFKIKKGNKNNKHHLKTRFQSVFFVYGARSKRPGQCSAGVERSLWQQEQVSPRVAGRTLGASQADLHTQTLVTHL